jgi:low temperature requirement protein LtrA
VQRKLPLRRMDRVQSVSGVLWSGGERMTTGSHNAELLREVGERNHRVTPIELFFDLVFVFAITQLSHLLLGHLDARGALQTGLLLLAIWQAWVYTAWVTNWFNPDVPVVRAMLVGVMAASLVVSATLPDAFADRGLTFATAFVAMEVGRTLFVVAALGGHPALRRNFQRILFWLTMSGLFWIAGGFATGTGRGLLWLSAVAIGYAGPACGYVTPRLGRSTTHDWNIAGGHLAERCQLFLIIALGESILVTGATLGELEWSTTVLAAFVVAFLGSVALWWIYFDRSAAAAEEIIVTSPDPGRLGRSAYTYLHLPMVAGIIVTAVGDELAIAHPLGHANPEIVATVLGGPVLFLFGHLLFKRAVFRIWSLSRVAAIGALAIVALIGGNWPPLALASAALLVVAAISWADARSLSRVTVPMTAG